MIIGDAVEKLDQLRDIGKCMVYDDTRCTDVVFYGSRRGCDTFFSWPGHIIRKGKRVKGYVVLNDAESDLVFHIERAGG